MDQLAEGLAPAFAAGFAVQRLLEVIDPLLSRVLKDQAKKITLALASFAIGFLLAWLGGLRVLAPLGVSGKEAVDIVVTGLIVSGGTEGFNSIMKFLGYKKEEKKAEATTAKDEIPANANPPAAG